MKTILTSATICILLSTLTYSLYAQNEDGMPTRRIISPESHSITVRNLGPNINSPADDFSPVVLSGGRVMYFTSDRTGNHDIYSAVEQGTNWSQPADVGSGLNTGNHEGGVAITPDGHWMVFVGCDRPDGQGDCDLYMAEYLGGTWRNVFNLGSEINSDGWESQPTISPDGMVIYFASDRDGGQGGTDIWMSTRTFGGEWQEPVNLGPVINTSGNEAAPYIAIDGKTLFFSSDQHPGIGGMDMYVTKKTGAVWSPPQHTGTPLNSEYDDYFYALQRGTDNVFYASDKPGGSGGLDLHVGKPNPFPPSAVTAVIGKVTDAVSGDPLGAVLTVSDIITNEPVATFHSDDINGDYTVILHPGKSYAITSQAPGYLFYSDRIDVPIDAPNNTVTKNIKMSKELTRLLVYFDFDKANLKPESYVDLDVAAAWLKSNPNLKIELAGHTDNVGSKDYNKRLSQERADATREYLVRKGINPARVRSVGYGMEQPIASNETEEGRALNRRVEMKVIGE
ncbi:MAG: hypothetical protein CL946_10565 [Ectothiorhodospiraceae bacterium]|nr:hypothetical protein [Ectothiorhodospiraceae bacterium]